MMSVLPFLCSSGSWSLTCYPHSSGHSHQNYTWGWVWVISWVWCSLHWVPEPQSHPRTVPPSHDHYVLLLGHRHDHQQLCHLARHQLGGGHPQCLGLPRTGHQVLRHILQQGPRQHVLPDLLGGFFLGSSCLIGGCWAVLLLAGTGLIGSIGLTNLLFLIVTRMLPLTLIG